MDISVETKTINVDKTGFAYHLWGKMTFLVVNDWPVWHFDVNIKYDETEGGPYTWQALNYRPAVFATDSVALCLFVQAPSPWLDQLDVRVPPRNLVIVSMHLDGHENSRRFSSYGFRRGSEFDGEIQTYNPRQIFLRFDWQRDSLECNRFKSIRTTLTSYLGELQVAWDRLKLVWNRDLKLPSVLNSANETEATVRELCEARE